jgi:hypothetical protein
MDTDARRRIENECRSLILEMTNRADHGDHAAAAQCYTQDGVWYRSGRTYAGRAAIEAAYKSGSPSRVSLHINGGTFVDVVSETQATCVTYYLAIVQDTGMVDPPLPVRLEPFSAGEWQDVMRLTADGWRIAERRLHRVFQLAD